MDKETAQKIRAQLDAIRAKADQVRKTADTLLGTLSSIPFLGGLVGGYITIVKTGIDGIDAAIDALDDVVDAAIPKAA